MPLAADHCMQTNSQPGAAIAYPDTLLLFHPSNFALAVAPVCLLVLLSSAKAPLPQCRPARPPAHFIPSQEHCWLLHHISPAPDTGGPALPSSSKRQGNKLPYRQSRKGQALQLHHQHSVISAADDLQDRPGTRQLRSTSCKRQLCAAGCQHCQGQQLQ
jgi:hypothetical protein